MPSGIAWFTSVLLVIVIVGIVVVGVIAFNHQHTIRDIISQVREISGNPNQIPLAGNTIIILQEVPSRLGLTPGTAKMGDVTTIANSTGKTVTLRGQDGVELGDFRLGTGFSQEFIFTTGSKLEQGIICPIQRP